ncbi:MAG: hypothetical protein JXB49_22460 [Bacteroidales bacterium]|nr:hypothetical protein [Bacteroidales bacterium]
MKIHILFVTMLVQFCTISYSQTDTLELFQKPMNIDNFIKYKANEKQQQNILIEFKKPFTEDDRITVEEFPEYYEIIVNHPSNNKLLGGAECYQVDKKNGESKMIWHEHPEPLPEIQDGLEMNAQEDTIK